MAAVHWLEGREGAERTHRVRIAGTRTHIVEMGSGDPDVAATLVLSILIGFLLDHHGETRVPPALVEGLHARLEAALGAA